MALFCCSQVWVTPDFTVSYLWMAIVNLHVQRAGGTPLRVKQPRPTDQAFSPRTAGRLGKCSAPAREALRRCALGWAPECRSVMQLCIDQCPRAMYMQCHNATAGHQNCLVRFLTMTSRG